jgi:hypothetical protein
VKYIPAPLRLLGAVAVSVGLYACLGNAPTPGAPSDDESPVGSVQQATATCSTSLVMAPNYGDPCESITTSGACTNHYVEANCFDPPCADWYLCSWNANQNPHCITAADVLANPPTSCIPACVSGSTNTTDCGSLTTQSSCNSHYHNDGSHKWRCGWISAISTCGTAGWCQ